MTRSRYWRCCCLIHLVVLQCHHLPTAAAFGPMSPSCIPQWPRRRPLWQDMAASSGVVPIQLCQANQNVADNLGDASESTLLSVNSNDRRRHNYAFYDRAWIWVVAGSGGQGARTYNQYGQADGGTGGNGGHVLLQVDAGINTLAHLVKPPRAGGGSGSSSSTTPRTFQADHGANGERGNKNGKFGKDIVIRVPPGTLVQEQLVRNDSFAGSSDDGGARNDLADLRNLARLHDPDQTRVVVARGGTGGEGTHVLAKKSNKRAKRQGQQGGERKQLLLTLTLLADVAIVGVPSAGKSTLLSAVTRAQPKVADYPFTTIVPNLGVWHSNNDDDDDDDHRRLVLCDVPGLLAGAAAHGVGLGHAFLRHVERCPVLLHVVDATSPDPVADYCMLNDELVQYSATLARSPQVVVVNKMDAFYDNDAGYAPSSSGVLPSLTMEELDARLRKVMPHSRLLWISAQQGTGVDELMVRLRAFVRKVQQSNSTVTTTDTNETGSNTT